MDNSKVIESIMAAKVGDLPPGFDLRLRIGDYQVDITIYSDDKAIEVKKEEGEGESSWVRIADPREDVTIGEIYRRARELIEQYIKRP